MCCYSVILLALFLSPALCYPQVDQFEPTEEMFPQLKESFVQEGELIYLLSTENVNKSVFLPIFSQGLLVMKMMMVVWLIWRECGIWCRRTSHKRSQWMTSSLEREMEGMNYSCNV